MNVSALHVSLCKFISVAVSGPSRSHAALAEDCVEKQAASKANDFGQAVMALRRNLYVLFYSAFCHSVIFWPISLYCYKQTF